VADLAVIGATPISNASELPSRRSSPASSSTSPTLSDLPTLAAHTPATSPRSSATTRVPPPVLPPSSCAATLPPSMGSPRLPASASRRRSPASCAYRQETTPANPMAQLERVRLPDPEHRGVPCATRADPRRDPSSATGCCSGSSTRRACTSARPCRSMSRTSTSPPATNANRCSTGAVGAASCCSTIRASLPSYGATSRPPGTGTASCSVRSRTS
jgi:hypothetical protein